MRADPQPSQRDPAPEPHLIAEFRGGGSPKPYDGAGSCYIEFGEHKLARVDADFLTGPSVTAPFYGPSLEKAGEKKEFASTRRRLWFGH